MSIGTSTLANTLTRSLLAELLGVPRLHLLVESGELLVGGLKFLLRGLKLLVQTLQLFVAGYELFVGGQELLIGPPVFLDDSTECILRRRSSSSSWPALPVHTVGLRWLSLRDFLVGLRRWQDRLFEENGEHVLWRLRP